MKNYDLNVNSGTHIVMATLQSFEYKGHVTLKVRGNCKGREILDCLDFEAGTDFSSNDCNIEHNEDYDIFTAELKDVDGNVLRVECDAEEMNQMIVAIEIIDFIKD